MYQFFNQTDRNNIVNTFLTPSNLHWFVVALSRQLPYRVIIYEDSYYNEGVSVLTYELFGFTFFFFEAMTTKIEEKKRTMEKRNINNKDQTQKLTTSDWKSLSNHLLFDTFIFMGIYLIANYEVLANVIPAK